MSERASPDTLLSVQIELQRAERVVDERLREEETS